MKISKTKRTLSILLSLMMILSAFSVMSGITVSAADTETALVQLFLPSYENAKNNVPFSASVYADLSQDSLISISDVNSYQISSYLDEGGTNVWKHCYNVKFKIYPRNGFDLSSISKVKVSDGYGYTILSRAARHGITYCTATGSETSQSSSSLAYIDVRVMVVPFEIYNNNSDPAKFSHFGMANATYEEAVNIGSKTYIHPVSLEMTTSLNNRSFRKVTTLSPSATSFSFKIIREGYENNAEILDENGEDFYTKYVDVYQYHTVFRIELKTESCNLTQTSLTPASCTADGEKIETCSKCGKKKTTVLPKLGHDFIKLISTTPATCTTGTKKIYQCTHCNETKEVVANDALGHDFSVLVSTVPATCSHGTQKTYKCSRCSETKTVTDNDIQNHNYTEIVSVTPATCTMGTKTVKKCQYCDKTVTTYANDALGHDFVYDTQNSVQPTVLTEGRAVYKCSRCGQTRTDIIPKLTEDSGYLLGGCQYTFNKSTGVLDIFPSENGTATGDYGNGQEPPWSLVNEAWLYSIKKVVFHEGVTNIGNELIMDSYLQEIVIPDTVKRIGEYAFANNHSITSLTVNGTNADIEEKAFINCKGLNTVTLSGVKTIGDYAFYNTGTTSYDLGNVQTIGSNAFEDNTNLTELTLPETTETVGKNFVRYCTSLSKITFLNESCVLSSTTTNDWGIPENAVIYCYSDSTVYSYAVSNNRQFVLLDEEPEPEVESVDLNKHTLVLGVGQAYTLRPIVTPEGAETTFRWKSSKKDIATVTSLGKVTGRAVGKATITVTTENGKTYSCPVVVKQAPDNITLNKSEMTLGVGQMYTLQSTLTPSNSATYQQWTSSNKTVAVVNDKGRVTGKKVGTAVITVKTTNGYTATCTVTVKKAPTSVALDKTAVTLAVGMKETLTAALTPTDSATYCAWSSSDETVATVTSGGVVTAKKAGTATITVKTTNDKTATCTVTVKKAPTDLTLDKTELSLKVGETYTLKKTLTPSNAYTTYTYTSSKTAVATVTSSGKVVAKKAGTAVITVTTHNGKTATCTVTVKS